MYTDELRCGIAFILLVAALNGTHFVLAQEPAIGLMVKIGDKEIEGLAGVPFDVEVEGKKHPLTVLMQPYRSFNNLDVAFKYPSYFSWQHETSKVSGRERWVIAGRRISLELYKSPTREKAESLWNVMRDALRFASKEFDLAEPSEAEVSINLNGNRLRGRSVRVSDAKSRFEKSQYEVFYLGESTTGGHYTLAFKDRFRKDDDEYDLLTDLLKSSLSVLPVRENP